LGSRIPSGAILTGGGAETVGIIDSAKRMLALPVRVGKPKGITGLIDDIINPQFANPVGLIVYGANQEIVDQPSSFASKLKLPTKGVAGKIIKIFKDLLP